MPRRCSWRAESGPSLAAWPARLPNVKSDQCRLPRRHPRPPSRCRRRRLRGKRQSPRAATPRPCRSRRNRPLRGMKPQRPSLCRSRPSRMATRWPSASRRRPPSSRARDPLSSWCSRRAAGSHGRPFPRSSRSPVGWVGARRCWPSPPTATPGAWRSSWRPTALPFRPGGYGSGSRASSRLPCRGQAFTSVRNSRSR
jgi:hypothetical protein